MRQYQRKNGKETKSAKQSQAAKGRMPDIGAAKRAKQKRKSNKIRDSDNRRQNYAVYHFNSSELVKYGMLYLALDGCISYLFFLSWYAFVLLLPGIYIFMQEIGQMLQKKRKKQMKTEFMDGIQMMSASLQAGYSPENAIREALKELEKMYQRNAFIVREFRLMDAQISMNRNLEELWMDFGRRSGIDDIQSFAEVFLTAKRSGGDLLAIIRNTVSCIRQKQETMQEIETCLAGKVMEQNVMSTIPVLILAYVKLSSPEFIGVMYGNIAGVIIMSICFVVYVIAYFWGRKIVRIDV